MPSSNLSPRCCLVCIGLLTAFAYLGGCAGEAPKPVGRAAAIDSYVQGVLAYNAGNKPKAVKELEDATRQHPNLVMAHSMLGDIYQSDRRYSDALVQYEITAHLDPGAYKNHYNQGLMEQLLGRVKEAIASYLRALKLQPADFLTNQNLGAAYLQLGDYDDAITYSRRATELNDKSAPAQSNLARAYEGKEQWKEAEACWRKVLELDGSAIDASVALATTLKHQQKYADARAILTDVVHASDTPAHRKLLGDALFLEKKYDQALAEYAQALRLDPHYIPALNETGWVLITEYNQSLGLDEPKRTAALDAWRKSLAINPNQLQVQKLAATYAEKMVSEPGR